MTADRPARRAREPLPDGAVLVELTGEIDALTAPRLTPYLDRLSTRDRPDIVVDLRPVTFIDCAGLAPLVRLRKRVHARSGRIRLVCNDPRTLRTLRTTRLSRHFPILEAPPQPSRSVDRA